MDYRILIIGSSCAGKTTLGAQLGRELNIKHIDLDELNWLPGWEEVGKQAMFAKVQQVVDENKSWVITGGYSHTQVITAPVATHIIFLDLPLYVLVSRLIKRTFLRVADKKPVCNGNYETWGHVFSKGSLILWQLKNYKKKKRDYRVLKERYENPQNKFLKFSRVRDVQTVIDAL